MRPPESRETSQAETSSRTPRIRANDAVPENVLRDQANKAEYDTPQIRLQRALQRHRENMQMPLEAVADRLRTTPEYIARIEQGEVDPSFSYLVKLAEAMGADLEVTLRPKEEQKEQDMTGQNVSKPETPKQA